MLTTTSLLEGWRVSLSRPDDATPAALIGADLPAAVPGCIHTDLLTAGLIVDPYLDRNEDDQHWIGNSDWRYAVPVTLEPTAADRVDLVFDGIDTIAQLRWDGEAIGETRNMFRGHRVDITSRASAGRHTLAVDLRSARAAAWEVRDQLGARPGVYAEPYQYVRKMACNFGWDWGPVLLTAGLWRDVRLETWSTARLAQVRPVVEVTGAPAGRATLHVTLERAGASEQVELSASCHGVTATATVTAYATEATIVLELPEVELWWPHDLGEQTLYPLQVTLSGEDGRRLDRLERRIAFRTIELRVERDQIGTSFQLAVNGRGIFTRGFNWIPDDCFPTRVDRARLRERIGQAVAANASLLRVWGGGLYESDAFYDLCDELGVLVWQDFAFACSAYPEEEPLLSEVEAEARDNVVRLAWHPSLVLWNGNNENIWGYHDWGWREALDGRTWGEGYYTELLPAIVAELDPTRPYWPGSPYAGSSDVHPNDMDHGPSHIWTVWNDLDYTEYRSYRPRFLSEFGFQAPPTWATLTAAVHDEPLRPDSAGVLAHQKAIDGNAKLARGLAPHLPAPRTTEEWHFLTQVNQAVAVRVGIEHARALRPVCQGAILWQLNDCWPVTSWSVVDGAGRLKPAWYAVRRAFAPRLITLQPQGGGGLEVISVNDGAGVWEGTLSLTRMRLDGRILATAVAPIRVPAGESVRTSCPPEIASAAHPEHEVIVARLGDEPAALWFFVEDKDLALEPAALAVVAEPAGLGQVRLVVTATSVVRHLLVQADRLDPHARVDDNLVTLLPGERHTITIETTVGHDHPGWTSAPVLWSVNPLVASH